MPTQYIYFILHISVPLWGFRKKNNRRDQLGQTYLFSVYTLTPKRSLAKRKVIFSLTCYIQRTC
jgi:hypothetical protein